MAVKLSFLFRNMSQDVKSEINICTSGTVFYLPKKHQFLLFWVQNLQNIKAVKYKMRLSVTVYSFVSGIYVL